MHTKLMSHSHTSVLNDLICLGLYTVQIILQHTQEDASFCWCLFAQHCLQSPSSYGNKEEVHFTIPSSKLGFNPWTRV